jgi:hypothetical protein
MNWSIFWTVLAAMVVYSTYEELLAYAKHRILSRKLDRAMEKAFERWDDFIEESKSKHSHPSGKKAKVTLKVQD